MAYLTGWPVGTKKVFNTLHKIAGVAVDISGDTVTTYIKQSKSDTNANALVAKEADVATLGSTAYAIHTIDDGDTKDVTHGTYYLGIEWVRSNGDEYEPYQQRITLIERISDVPDDE